MQILHKCSVSNFSEVLDTGDDCALTDGDLCSLLWGALRCGTASDVCFPLHGSITLKLRDRHRQRDRFQEEKKYREKNSILARDAGGDRACLLEFTEVLLETGCGLLPHYSGL